MAAVVAQARRPSDKFTWVKIKSRHKRRPEGPAGIDDCRRLLLDISDARRAGRIDDSAKAKLKSMLAKGDCSARDCRAALEAQMSPVPVVATASAPTDVAWYEYVAPDGRIYYGCPSNNTSRWDRPASDNIWRIFTDSATGKQYVHNAATGQTKWFGNKLGKKQHGAGTAEATDLVRALSKEEQPNVIARDVVQQVFESYDQDHNGELSVPELHQALFSVGCDLRFSEVVAIFRQVDVDGNGVIVSDEFCNWAEESGAFQQWKDEVLPGAANRDGDGGDDDGGETKAPVHRLRRASHSLGRALFQQYLSQPAGADPPTATVALMACVICQDPACPEIEGVSCHSKTHFFCNACFNSFVLNEAGRPIEVRAREQGQLRCPFVRECKSAEPFSDAQVATHVQGATFQLWMDAKIALLEARISREADARVKLEMQNHLRKSALEQVLHGIRIHIEEEIMTIRCPKCRQPFVDYTGCAALTCSSCQCHFCALCLKDCGANAHPHVKKCKLNPLNPKGYFVKVSAFTKIHAKRKRGILRDYWKGQPADVRAAAAKDPAIRQHFQEHRINVKTGDFEGDDGRRGKCLVM